MDKILERLESLEARVATLEGRPVEEPVEVSHPSAAVIVYTDGSCLGNPGAGGWGWICTEGQFRGGHEKQTTNNRMEMMAVVQAIETFQSLDKDIVVYSDSEYVCNGINKKWFVNWEHNGWKTKKGTAVKNMDLWKRLVQLFQRNSVDLQWVKGHQTQEKWNNLADKLAKECATQQKDVHGTL